MRLHAQRIRASGASIAFVPTMGFFHEGHLSLMRLGRNLADHLVVSIFVNPTQFAAGEDYAAYPRNPARDSELARNENVDTLFLPQAKDLYPHGFESYVRLDNLSDRLCGHSRPTHFTGVATIVTKLFNIVRPRVAIFGKKDYQQWIIIKRMVRDLDMDIEIVGAPTVREPDGLAMSSRNCHLTKKQRVKALSLYQALKGTSQSVAAGTKDVDRIRHEAVRAIGDHSDVSIDYVVLCDPDTLEEVSEIKRPVLMALAVKVGKTRLIDNMLLTPPAN
jgi:pantoate--beta-alanine ligase